VALARLPRPFGWSRSFGRHPHLTQASNICLTV
jgi:hypothetical protein